VVADLLEVLDLIEIHPRLPEPFGFDGATGVALIEPNCPRAFGEARRIVGLPRTPHYRRTHRHGVRFFRRQGLARIRTALAPHAIICAGQIANGPIARTISEKPAGEPQLLAGFDVLGDYGRYLLTLCLHLKRVGVEEKADVVFGVHNAPFLVVLKSRRFVGVAFGYDRHDFPHQVAQGGIGPLVEITDP